MIFFEYLAKFHLVEEYWFIKFVRIIAQRMYKIGNIIMFLIYLDKIKRK